MSHLHLSDLPIKNAASSTIELSPPFTLNRAQESSKPQEGKAFRIIRGRQREDAADHSSRTDKMKTFQHEDRVPSRQETEKRADNEERYHTYLQGIETTLKHDLLKMVPTEDQPRLQSLFQRLTQHGVSLEHGEWGQGTYYNAERRVIFIDMREAADRPTKMVWDLAHEYFHLLERPTLPKDCASALEYARSRTNQEVDIMLNVVELKISDWQKRGHALSEQKSQPLQLPLEIEYLQEYTWQEQRLNQVPSNLHPKARTRVVREETRKALLDRASHGELTLITSRGSTYMDHYHAIYEKWQNNQQAMLEYPNPSSLERGEIEKTITRSGVRDHLLLLYEKHKIEEHQLLDAVNRWKTLQNDLRENSKHPYIDQHPILAAMPDEMLGALLIGKFTPLKLFEFAYNKGQSSLAMNDLLPHLVGNAKKSAVDINLLRSGWQRIVARDFNWLEPDVHASILSMKAKDMFLFLKGSTDFHPLGIKIARETRQFDPERGVFSSQQERYISVEAEKFLLQASRPQHEVAHIQHMEARMRGEINGVEGLTPETLKKVEALPPSVRWELLMGRIESDKLRMVFPVFDTAGDHYQSARHHQWQIKLLLQPEHQTFADYKRALLERSGLDAGSAAAQALLGRLEKGERELETHHHEMKELWDTLLKKLDKPRYGQTRQYLMTMEEQRGLATSMLQYHLLALSKYGHTEKYPDEQLDGTGLRQCFSFVEDHLPLRGMFDVLPQIMQKPADRDYSKPLPIDGHLATPQEIVHKWLARADDMGDFILIRDLATGCPIPTTPTNSAFVGRSGTGKTSIQLQPMLFQRVCAFSSTITTDRKNKELEGLIGGSLLDTKVVRRLALEEGHSNILDDIPTYNEKLLLDSRKALETLSKDLESRQFSLSPEQIEDIRAQQTHYRLQIKEQTVRKEQFEIAIRDFALTFLDETLYPDTLKNAGMHFPGSYEKTQEIIIATLTHLRIKEPEAPFYRFVELLSDITLLQRVIVDGKCTDAIDTLKGVLNKVPPETLTNGIAPLLSSSVRTMHDDNIKRMTSKTDVPISELIGRLDARDKTRLDADWVPIELYLQFALELDVKKQAFPYARLLLHARTRGAVYERNIRDAMNWHQGVPLFIPAEESGVAGSIPRVNEAMAYYREPGKVRIGVVLQGTEQMQTEKILTQLEYIYMAGANFDDAKWLSEFIGPAVQKLRRSSFRGRELSSGSHGIDFNTISFQAEKKRNTISTLSAEHGEEEQEISNPYILPHQVRDIIYDKMFLISQGKPPILGTTENTDHVVYAWRRNLAERNQITGGAVPGATYPDWTYNEGEYTPPRRLEKALAPQQALDNFEKQLHVIDKKMDTISNRLSEDPAGYADIYEQDYFYLSRQYQTIAKAWRGQRSKLLKEEGVDRPFPRDIADHWFS